MSTALPTATVVLVGDFNTLDDSEVNSRSALNSIVNRPTRGAHNLDRIYISDACYENVHVVRSTVKSDHQAVIAYTGPRLLPQNKSREQCTLRLRSPTQNALFLEHASNLKISFSDDTDMRTNFDNMYMYAITRDLLNRFYPERTITVTSFDPRFVTAESMMVHHCSLNDVSTICCHQKKITSYKLRNSDCSYVLPQCNSSVFKRSFINWCLFMLYFCCICCNFFLRNCHLHFIHARLLRVFK